MGVPALAARIERAARARWLDDWSPRERRLAFDLGDVAARISETRLQLRELVAFAEVAW